MPFPPQRNTTAMDNLAATLACRTSVKDGNVTLGCSVFGDVDVPNAKIGSMLGGPDMGAVLAKMGAHGRVELSTKCDQACIATLSAMEGGTMGTVAEYLKKVPQLRGVGFRGGFSLDCDEGKQTCAVRAHTTDLSATLEEEYVNGILTGTLGMQPATDGAMLLVAHANADSVTVCGDMSPLAGQIASGAEFQEVSSSCHVAQTSKILAMLGL